MNNFCIMDWFLSFHKGVSLLIKSMIFKKRFFNIIDKDADKHKIGINVGGGHYYRRHWKVLDVQSDHYNFQMALIDYNFDLTNGKPLPFENSSISFFYSSHAIEHIPQEYCQGIFNEMFRSLKPGGVVRFSVPDFDLAYNAFAKNQKKFFDFLNPKDPIERSFLDFFAGYKRDKVSYDRLRKDFDSMGKEDFADYYVKDIPSDSQKKSIGSHISWWNYDKFERMLKKAGFEEIYQTAPQESRFSEMRGKGIYWGFDSTDPEQSLFMEAVKK